MPADRLLAVAVTAAAVTAGCSTPPPAVSDLRLSDDEPPQRLVLNPAEQREIRRILARLAADHEPVNPPAPAPHGVRWSDVEHAAALAARDAEMAILSTAREPDMLIFTLRTIEEHPAALTIRRTHDTCVYQAEATVGRLTPRPNRSQHLVARFDHWMAILGRRRTFDHPDHSPHPQPTEQTR